MPNSTIRPHRTEKLARRNMAGDDEEMMLNHYICEKFANLSFCITTGGLHPHPILDSLRVALRRPISPNSRRFAKGGVAFVLLKLEFRWPILELRAKD
jgi:hypothetical protein